MPDDNDFNEDPNKEINRPEGASGTNGATSNNEQLLNDVRNKTSLIKVLGQDLVVISSDKLRLAYAEHIKKRELKGAWIAPVGLFASLLLSLLTNTFADAFGVSGASWKAFFMLGAFITFLWSAVALLKAIKSPPVDDVEAFISSITVGGERG